MPSPAIRVDAIDLRGRPGDVSRHAPHHGIGYPRHRHDAIELNVVTGGRGAYLVGDRRVDLVPGRLLWLFADEAHHLAAATRLDYWIVYFDPDLIRRANVHRPGNGDPLVRDVTVDQCRLLHGICADLLHAEAGPLAEAGFTYLLQRAWADTLSGRPVGPQPRTLSDGIQAVIAVLREGRSAPGLAEAAALAGLSTTRFPRRFRDEVGCGFAAYRERALVERACAAWRRGTSWEALAARVGFGSYRQFHRAFTRIMGCSPRRWRSPGGG